MPLTPPKHVSRDAVMSPCGRYRYTLTRDWSCADEPRALFIMLNPSTADALEDDPTIRRCVAFATREGCGSLEVANCYAWRTADPVLLWGNRGQDIVGPDNVERVRTALGRASLVICAWGAYPVDSSPVPGLLANVECWCLGVTKNGSPRHPLYVRGDAPLVRWPVAGEQT